MGRTVVWGFVRQFAVLQCFSVFFAITAPQNETCETVLTELVAKSGLSVIGYHPFTAPPRGRPAANYISHRCGPEAGAALASAITVSCERASAMSAKDSNHNHNQSINQSVD